MLARVWLQVIFRDCWRRADRGFGVWAATLARLIGSVAEKLQQSPLVATPHTVHALSTECTEERQHSVQSAGQDQCTQCTVHNSAQNISLHSVHSAFGHPALRLKCTVQEWVNKPEGVRKSLSSGKSEVQKGKAGAYMPQDSVGWAWPA